MVLFFFFCEIVKFCEFFFFFWSLSLTRSGTLLFSGHAYGKKKKNQWIVLSHESADRVGSSPT